MEESEIPIFDNDTDARAFTKTVSDEEFFGYLVKIWGNRAKANSYELFRKTSDQLTNDNFWEYSIYCNAYAAREQLAIAEAQKQLAENQTQLAEQQKQIAERQERIAKRIEQGSDRTMKLTKRITCLTYVLVAVGIITFSAVCVQIAVAKHWL